MATNPIKKEREFLETNIEKQTLHQHHIDTDTSTPAFDTSKFSKIFTSPTEKFVTALGNNYVQSFITSGNISNGFAVVSDKRVYFKGTAYYREGKKLKKRNEERIIDLQDVTGTGYTLCKQLGFLLTFIISTIIAVLAIVIVVVLESEDLLFIAGACLLTGLAFLFMYFTNLMNLFEISSSGAVICFDTSWYNKEEIDDFQKHLRLAKDNYIANNPVKTVSEQQFTPQQPSYIIQQNTSSMDDLTSAAKLYKEGLLTEAEFKEIKANILSKKG